MLWQVKQGRITVPIHSLLSYPSVILPANVRTLHLHLGAVTEEDLQVLTEWLTRTSAPPKPSFAGLSRIRVGVALHIRWETHSGLCLLQAGLAFPVCWQHTSSPSRFWTCERGKALFATTSGFLHLKRHGWSSQSNIRGAQTLLHIVRSQWHATFWAPISKVKQVPAKCLHHMQITHVQGQQSNQEIHRLNKSIMYCSDFCLKTLTHLQITKWS